MSLECPNLKLKKNIFSTVVIPIAGRRFCCGLWGAFTSTFAAATFARGTSRRGRSAAVVATRGLSIYSCLRRMSLARFFLLSWMSTSRALKPANSSGRPSRITLRIASCLAGCVTLSSPIWHGMLGGRSLSVPRCCWLRLGSCKSFSVCVCCKFWRGQSFALGGRGLYSPTATTPCSNRPWKIARRLQKPLSTEGLRSWSRTVVLLKMKT